MPCGFYVICHYQLYSNYCTLTTIQSFKLIVIEQFTIYFSHTQQGRNHKVLFTEFSLQGPHWGSFRRDVVSRCGAFFYWQTTFFGLNSYERGTFIDLGILICFERGVRCTHCQISVGKGAPLAPPLIRSLL